MDYKIPLELGVIYEVTYIDGTKIRFKIVGGPNLEAHVINSTDRETSTVASILRNFESIVKINE